jgi:integrase
MAVSPKPKVTLRVKDQGGGPVIYARFRWEATHAEPALGRGWLVPAGSELAKPKGKVVGGWVERRGRPPEGTLSVDGAWQLVPDVIGRYSRKADEEAKRRAEDARLRLRDAVELWLAARSVDDPNGERDAWKHSHAKNMTSYAHRFVRELGPDRHVDTFRTAELRRWLAEDLKPMRNGEVLGQSTSRKMRSTYAQALVGFFTYAVTQGWVGTDPTAGLPAYRTRRKRSDDPLRRDEYLTKSELRRALAELRRADPWSPARSGRKRSDAEREQDAAIIMVMAMAGLRPGEAIALLWEHIDFRAKVIRVVESRTMGVTDAPKSGSGRTVPMADEIADALGNLQTRTWFVSPTDLVFVGRDGAYVDKAALGRRFASAQAAAGIAPPRELRQMRNTFGTVCAAEGLPLRAIQQWMGHASITTTEIYASFMPRERDAAVIGAAFA